MEEPENSRDLPDEADLCSEARLLDLVGQLEPSVVAFSGGVDSSYLLSVAAEVQGPARVQACLGVSPSLSRHQQRQARSVAASLAVVLLELPTREVEHPDYRANLGRRCFFCKDELFSIIQRHFPRATILEGSNQDDLQGHRPGMQAAQQHGVRSPLLEVGLKKDAIRRLSRRRGLKTADLPAMPCLASRMPAGVRVDAASLKRVEAAEAVLREEGLVRFRVRHHGDLARLELPLAELGLLAGTALGQRIAARLEGLGYRFVSLDLRGFASGRGCRLPDQE